MQIIHVVTAVGQSVKEPFTKQGYFYKMHLKCIIKITHKEAAMLDAQTIATVKATIPCWLKPVRN
jgi:nitric oxide dioxygenase